MWSLYCQRTSFFVVSAISLQVRLQDQLVTNLPFSTNSYIVTYAFFFVNVRQVCSWILQLPGSFCSSSGAAIWFIFYDYAFCRLISISYTYYHWWLWWLSYSIDTRSIIRIFQYLWFALFRLILVWSSCCWNVVRRCMYIQTGKLSSYCISLAESLFAYIYKYIHYISIHMFVCVHKFFYSCQLLH